MWVVRVTGDGWFGEKNLTLLLVEKENLAATGFDIRRERDEYFRVVRSASMVR